MKRYVKAKNSAQHYVIDIVATFEFREEKVAASTNYIVHTKKRGSKFAGGRAPFERICKQHLSI